MVIDFKQLNNLVTVLSSYLQCNKIVLGEIKMK